MEPGRATVEQTALVGDLSKAKSSREIKEWCATEDQIQTLRTLEPDRATVEQTALVGGLSGARNSREIKEMVPLARIERALPCEKQILNLSRLPVPPQGQWTKLV